MIELSNRLTTTKTSFDLYDGNHNPNQNPQQTIYESKDLEIFMYP